MAAQHAHGFGPAFKVCRIVFAALIMSEFLYLGLVVVVSGQQNETTTIPNVMVYVLAGMSVLTLTSLPIVRSLLLPRVRPGSHTNLKDHRELDQKQGARLQRNVTASVVTWALAESIAVYGLVLGFVGRNVQLYLPFMMVSLIAMAFYAPRRDQFAAAVAGS